MNSQTQRIQFLGHAGAIEGLLDLPPVGSPGGEKGVAIIAHPHPMFGGTMDNKVVQTIARACVSAGWRSVRFNFRGVGASDGVHDAGVGETDDFFQVIAQTAPAGHLLIAGFSFGAFVCANVLKRLLPEREPHAVILVGTAVSRFDVPGIPTDLHGRTLTIHGESDDTVPLADVMNWARPQLLPLTVIPGVGHFFHGQLPLLRGLIQRHLT